METELELPGDAADASVRTDVWELGEVVGVSSKSGVLDTAVDFSVFSVVCEPSVGAVICLEPVLLGRTVDPSDRTVVWELACGTAVLVPGRLLRAVADPSARTAVGGLSENTDVRARSGLLGLGVDAPSVVVA